MDKSEIRKKILKIRKKNFFKNSKIDFKEVLKVLKKNKVKGKILGGYYPYNYELDGMQILHKFENQNYFILLPKIKKDSQMNFFEWSTEEPLLINKYGIPEPISNKVGYPDILLVPLVAFDKSLNRIGYGAGYYDRYIRKIKKKKTIITIGMDYSFQETNKIPVDKYDIKLDFIITEKQN